MFGGKDAVLSPVCPPQPRAGLAVTSHEKAAERVKLTSRHFDTRFDFEIRHLGLIRFRNHIRLT